jgi:CRP/FNR family cyclic AMP-dependent transcriptional regulator
MQVHPKTRCRSECGVCQYRSMRMFCNLSPDALADFDRIGMQTRVPKGTILFQEDDPSNGVIVICSGQAKLSCSSRQGKTLILRIAMAGDVLGLGAVLSESRHEVTAETLEPTLIKQVRSHEFLEFLSKHSEASLHAAKALSEEYKTAFIDARRLALAPSAAGKLASVLLEWGRSSASSRDEMRFTMALTHEELANLAGTSRETVTRVLGKLQREKLIQIHGSSILILAPEKLAELSA